MGIEQLLDRGGGGGGPGGPITGEDFRDWADRLRDVEEMLDDPELRAEAARIRDRAEDARAEFKRHAKEPDWTKLQDLVAEPLVELSRRIGEEIRRQRIARCAGADRPRLRCRRNLPSKCGATTSDWGAANERRRRLSGVRRRGAWVALALAGVGAVALAWSYWRSAVDARRASSWPASLKAIGLAGLALCLVEPLLSGTRARRGANMFAIVADNSQSMSIHDRGDADSRGERAAGAARRRTRLAEATERRISMPGDLRSTRTCGRSTISQRCTFDGARSSLIATLNSLSRRFRGLPLAGVLLLTDGNATDAARRRVGRSAAGLSGRGRRRRIAAGRVASRRFRQPDEFRVGAGHGARRYRAAAASPGRAIVARLFDEAGKEVQSQTVDCRRTMSRVACGFNCGRKSDGVSFYRVRVVVGWSG